ncbi:amino acid permease 8-like [Papaver somniferum]|uniref:amino acid permease 8-like n=1 Tax=Papaver somniferum TaxID=3469 RepID=UPI000E7040EA|nr:amino acid permease 8-like [Papaver somniferum]
MTITATNGNDVVALRVQQENLEPKRSIGNGTGIEDLDDDGKPRRTGSTISASAHIITAVIGAGVLSLPWCIAQLGWVAGPIALAIFAYITFYTASLLADCYRYPDPRSGKRNYNYSEAVGTFLGPRMQMTCGIIQYVNLFGYSVGYTVTAVVSMVAVFKASCFHKRGLGNTSCRVSNFPFMVGFGICEVILSQIPNISELTILSTIATLMSFTYSSIGVLLSVNKIAKGNTGKTSLTGVKIGPGFSVADKVWSTFSAIGDVQVAFSFSLILIEIQDTMKGPGENKKMKMANLISIMTTTVFYALCGCLGYAAYGNDAPGNMLSGIYDPLWLVVLANVCIVVHLVGAYQVYNQPLYAAVESWSSKKWENSKFVNHKYSVSIPGFKTKKCHINMFRIVWRSCYVIVATLLAMALPFFNDILSFLGATGYWPLTIYFPISMYISRKEIKKYSSKWIALQSLNAFCLICSIVAACGAVRGIAKSLANNPFKAKN